jgi:hypothetical protein
MTARIKLIVTGDMERQALAESLRRCFPSQKSDGDDVLWERPRKLNCATSNRLPLNPMTVSTQMKAMARAMIDEAIDGKTGHPADLVIAIDDVEVANLGQEALIGEHFRLACQEALDDKASSAQTRARYAQIVQARCSFHLLRPMVEAYIFADAAALSEAGVQNPIAPMLRHPNDVEEFEVADPSWLPQCQLANGSKRMQHPWWREECHPKRYLEHLVRQSSGGSYDETDQGRRALLNLHWASAAAMPTGISLLRALFEDISDWFGVQNPLGAGAAAAAFYPARTVVRQGLLLRNQ